MLSPFEISHIDQTSTSHAVNSPLLGLKSSQPAIELGLDKGGILSSRSDPALCEINSDGRLGGPADLKIDMHSANMQDLLLQAAAKNADLQLGTAPNSP